MVVEDIFPKLCAKPTVFKNTEILRKGHHPCSLQEVLHRDGVIIQYSTFLKDAMFGIVPDNILIYGTFGVGKTMLTKLITSELVHAVNQAGRKIIVIYIYCGTMNALSQIMRYINQTLFESIPNLTKKVMGGSNAKNFEYFFELVNQSDVPIVIIFDEIDKLKDPNVINEFSRIKECGFTKNNVCVIGITNDTNFYTNLDGRTKSVIGQHELFIKPYNAEELAGILEARAKVAFVDGALDRVVIPICSAFGAQDNGDARLALDLLRVAGELADERGNSIIEEIDARTAKNRIELNRQLEVVGSLPTQTKAVLFASVYKYEQVGANVEATDVYTAYSQICKIINLDPVTQRRVNDYLGELNVLGILSVNKISRGRKRGVYNAVKPLVGVYPVEDIILRDFRFEGLKNVMLKSNVPDFEL
jgi:cell division control protein 6